MTNINNLLGFLMILGIVLFTNCKSSVSKDSTETSPAATTGDEVVPHPDWVKNNVIYEVNLRQFSKEANIAAFEKDLPRLKDLGIDILWFMPVHPISKEKRKATEELEYYDIEDLEERKKYPGSPYSVADYKGVNPDFGTTEEFKAMVKKIHKMGMKIIIDWVPNHTGWDHPWITEHPDYYTQVDGKIIDPIDYNTGKSWGWTDVADLNYDNPKMRAAMLSDMKYWLTDMNIDGFRMDVAHGVPTDFWETCSKELRATKPGIFLLAEGEVPGQRNSGSFLGDYGWTMHHLLNEIARGEKPATVLDDWLKEDREKFEKGFHMNFITNHDENSWAGTVEERMGDAADAMAVLCFTFDGMPLIYSGQEAPMKKRLKFFEYDPIDWNGYQKTNFLKKLTSLKHKNQAIWSGVHGGEVQKLEHTGNENLFAFTREKEGDRVIVILNLSKKTQRVSVDLSDLEGGYSNVLEQGSVNLGDEYEVTLGPWGAMLFSNK